MGLKEFNCCRYRASFINSYLVLTRLIGRLNNCINGEITTWRAIMITCVSNHMIRILKTVFIYQESILSAIGLI